MDQEKIDAFRRKQEEDAKAAQLAANHEELAGTLNNLLLATMVSKDPKMIEVAKNLGDLLQAIGQASDQFSNSSLHLLPLSNQALAESVADLANRITEYSPNDLEPYFKTLTRQLNMIAGTKPVVNVPTQPVTVDLRPLLTALKEVQKEVKANKIDIPQTDLSDVVKGLKAVQKTINGLTFPVPNYVLPFKDTTGKATQVILDADGKVPVSSTFSPSGTQDVNLTKVNGTATATGHGTASGAIRVELPTDGTGLVNAAQSGSWSVTANAGTNLNTSALALESGGNLASIKTNTDKIPALGQALAAGSVPVVLTAAQLTTLTPVSTVTANAGTNLNTSALALESGGNLAGAATSLAIIDDWDESDRAKVNPIVGQAGVAGGVGTPGATTQRVTEARASTSNVTAVADTASSTTLLAANSSRLGASIQNDSSAVLYVKFGTTATSTDYTVRMVQYAYYEVPFGYTGRIDGIWASDPGDGGARITEVSA